MQSAGGFLLNVQDANNTINCSLKKSVQYHVLKEQHRINSYLLDYVEVDHRIGSLSSWSDKIWFKASLDSQNRHSTGQCMECNFQSLKHWLLSLQFDTDNLSARDL